MGSSPVSDIWSHVGRIRQRSIPKVVGFLRIFRFPPKGKVEKPVREWSWITYVRMYMYTFISKLWFRPQDEQSYNWRRASQHFHGSIVGNFAKVNSINLENHVNERKKKSTTLGGFTWQYTYWRFYMAYIYHIVKQLYMTWQLSNILLWIFEGIQAWIIELVTIINIV